MIFTNILQLSIVFLFPFFSLRLEKQGINPSWLSPVIQCYAIGIILGNLPFLQLNDVLSNTITEVCILIAIPLLLFSSRIGSWQTSIRKPLFAFGLCILSGLVATSVIAWMLYDKYPGSWQLSGMLVGIYTGGTPNQQAIGMALEASKESILLIAGADILCGGILLIFLTSGAHSFFGLFLPASKSLKINASPDFVFEDPRKNHLWHKPDSLYTLGLTLIIIGLSAGLTYLIKGELKSVSLLLLLLTTFSLLASASARVRQWKGTYETGEYFLLAFCIALGMLANFNLLIDQGGALIFYTALALGLTLLLQSFLAWLFKVDRDTMMISITAAIYGPAFVGQIASTIKNRYLILPGIALGLLGYAIGNYLGISVAYLLKAWFLAS